MEVERIEEEEAWRAQGVYAGYYKGAPLYHYAKLFSDNHLNLPSLPVPSLEETMANYLRSVEPLVASEEELAKHKQVAQDFQATTGKALQKKLEDSAAATRGFPYSYIEKTWLEAYLTLRCPSVVNINPFYKVEDDAGPHAYDQVMRAASFVSACVRWTRKVVAGQLEPEQPALCQSSFYRMFSTARLPRPGCDVVKTYPGSNHIVVLCNGHIFSLQLLTEEGSLLDIPGIEAQLRAIKLQAAEAPGIGLGAMTTEDREVWSTVRRTLEEHSGNRDVLHTIDSAIVVLALDPPPIRARDRQVSCSNLLHGNPRDRWYDKHVIVVDGAGGLGMLYDHSSTDGHHWQRLINETVSAMCGVPSGFTPLPVLRSHSGTHPTAVAKHLMVELSVALEGALSNALAQNARLANSVDLDAYVFFDFGKREIKKWGVSPDAVVQLAFKLAYCRLLGMDHGLPPTYETGLTRRFFHGRTETIRSTTPESAAFVHSVLRGDAPPLTKRLFLKATSAHLEISKRSSNGHGVDRVLMALKKVAEAEGEALPLFFAEPIFKHSANFTLSTSNTSFPYLDFVGYGGPSEGWGPDYILKDNAIHICISGWRGNNTPSCMVFGDTLTMCLRDLKLLMAPTSRL